jgi:hypothetical protein
VEDPGIMIKAWCIGVFGALLLAAGCGSGSSAEQVQPKDATVDGKAGADAATGVDSKTVATDTAGTDTAGTPDSRPGDLGKDSALAPEDAPVALPIDAPEVDAAREPLKQDGPKSETLPIDMGVDARPDLGPFSEAGAAKPDSAADTFSGPPNFTCRNDSDCCIKTDTCMNVAYMYSKAPGASPEPDFQPSTTGWCTACIPPTVQVRCVTNQCVGEKLPTTSSGSLPFNHCGPIKLDAGASAYHDLPSDAGALPPQSRWSCGG